MGRGVCALFLGLTGFLASSASAEQEWVVRDGTIRLHFFSDTLDQLQLTINSEASDNKLADLGSAELLLSERQPLALATSSFRTGILRSERVLAADGLLIRRGAASVSVREFVSLSAPTTSDAPVLLLSGTRAGLTEQEERAVVPVEEVLISRGLAAALGQPLLEGSVIGRAVISGRAEWTGGEREMAAVNLPPARLSESVASMAGGAPDVTFCELYGLQQFGRLGSIVGLAMNTTSWNVGTADLRWFGAPGEEHPFIVMNAYRLKDDRFEQIGQSWVKHGFFALDDEQCGTQCTYEPGHGQGDWLGVGCTDIYTASLNATQSGLGPRQEINPWTGAWEYTGSHINLGGGGHTAISHRLQIHDTDLNPPDNAGATYYIEGYYVHIDDIDVMNSAAWKPFTINSGAPGGTWTFGTTGFSVRPNDGFAIDAWTGATQTVLAQQVPVQEFVSPDGRCILAAKATDLGGGMWNYEYALLNIDMDRKVKSFSIPIDLDATVQNIGFHAPNSHNESYDNVPWSGTVSTNCPTSDRCVTWSTTNNPVRWGTMYNFRFDADSPPQQGQAAAGGISANSVATLGLFEPGSPNTVSGLTIGPEVGVPIPAASAWTLLVLALLVLSAGSIAVARKRTALAAL